MQYEKFETFRFPFPEAEQHKVRGKATDVVGIFRGKVNGKKIRRKVRIEVTAWKDNIGDMSRNINDTEWVVSGLDRPHTEWVAWHIPKEGNERLWEMFRSAPGVAALDERGGYAEIRQDRWQTNIPDKLIYEQTVCCNGITITSEPWTDKLDRCRKGEPIERINHLAKRTSAALLKKIEADKELQSK